MQPVRAHIFFSNSYKVLREASRRQYGWVAEWTSKGFIPLYDGSNPSPTSRPNEKTMKTNGTIIGKIHNKKLDAGDSRLSPIEEETLSETVASVIAFGIMSGILILFGAITYFTL